MRQREYVSGFRAKAANRAIDLVTAQGHQIPIKRDYRKGMAGTEQKATFR
jgi:hypothetical protein